MLQVHPRPLSATIDEGGWALEVIMTSIHRQAPKYVAMSSPECAFGNLDHLSRSSSTLPRRSSRTSDASDITDESRGLCSHLYKGYGEPRYWNFKHVLLILVCNIISQMPYLLISLIGCCVPRRRCSRGSHTKSK